MRSTFGHGGPAKRVEQGGYPTDFTKKNLIDAVFTIWKAYRLETASITGRISRLGILFPMGEANLTGTTRQKLPIRMAQAVPA